MEAKFAKWWLSGKRVLNHEILRYSIFRHSLVGGIPTPLKKYEFVSWDDDIPNIWKNTICSKPPTSSQYVVAVMSEHDFWIQF